MKQQQNVLGCGALIVLLVLFIGCSGIFRWTTIESNISVTVKDKERVVNRSGDSVKSYYLVFTEDETFMVRDDWYNGKFAASDTYGSLEKEKRYKIRVCGWRVPIFSWYRNILDVELVQ